MGRILSGTVSQLGLAGQTLWVTAEGRSFQALATTNISSRNVAVLIDDNGRVTVSDANAGRPILTETRRFHQGKGKKKEEEKPLDFVAALVRYVPSIRIEEIGNVPEPTLIEDAEIYLLMGDKYEKGSDAVSEWRPAGLPLIGDPDPGVSLTVTSSPSQVSINTSTANGGGAYFATFFGYAARGSASLSATRSGNATSSASIYSPRDAFPQVIVYEGNESATFSAQYDLFAQLSVSATPGNATSAVTLSNTEMLQGFTEGRSWSHIDQKGWVAWVIMYERAGANNYPSDNWIQCGNLYLEERIYGFSGTGKKISKRKVYARRYHDDGTSQYAEGETVNALSFSATPVELKDFWENPKSPNLAWGQTVTPGSTDDCANEYQDRSFVSYLPKKKKVFTMQRFSINAAIEDGGSIILAEQRVSATSPTCTVGPFKNLNKRLKKWTGDGDPPEAVSAAYYPT